MSRKYMNGRWCVRCNRTQATPYLRDMFRRSKIGWELYVSPARIHPKYALDIGCGNRRNTNYLRNNGWDVAACDMGATGDLAGDVGTSLILGHDPLPYAKVGYYQLLLANFVLMFLSPNERRQVYREIDKVSGVGTALVVELYPAKDSVTPDKHTMLRLQAEVIEKLGRRWHVVHATQGHMVLLRYKKETK